MAPALRRRDLSSRPRAAGLLAALFVLARLGIAAAAEPSAAKSASGEASGEEGWELVEREDAPGESYELWERLPPGSEWRAFRLVGDVDVPPEVAIGVAMEEAADVTNVDPGETRKLLERTPDVIVTYTRVEIPMASDRDVATRLERQRDSEEGGWRLVYREVNERAPPLEDGVVRMPLARGSWIFRPLPGGRTQVVFETHADLGGSLPAWLINPFIGDTIKGNLADLRAAIAKRGN